MPKFIKMEVASKQRVKQYVKGANTFKRSAMDEAQSVDAAGYRMAILLDLDPSQHSSAETHARTIFPKFRLNYAGEHVERPPHGMTLFNRAKWIVQNHFYPRSDRCKRGFALGSTCLNGSYSSRKASRRINDDAMKQVSPNHHNAILMLYLRSSTVG